MPKLSTILLMLVCLIIGVVIGVGAKTIEVELNESPPKDFVEQQQPERTVIITFDESQQEEFFTQMRKFAEKWAYAIRIAPTNLDKKVYLIQLWREDIKIIAINNYGACRFSVGFFETYPTRPVPDQHFDEELIDFEHFIRAIPTADFSIQK